MGTFGTGIFDNDSSFDIHLVFFYKFFIGIPIRNIKEKIKEEYDYQQESFEEGYFADLERDDYLVSILNCLWHIGKTDRAMIEALEKIIKSDDSLKRWSNGNDIKERKEVLKEFLVKISKPKSFFKIFLFFTIRVLLYLFLFPLRFISIEKMFDFLSKIWCQIDKLKNKTSNS